MSTKQRISPIWMTATVMVFVALVTSIYTFTGASKSLKLLQSRRSTIKALNKLNRQQQSTEQVFRNYEKKKGADAPNQLDQLLLGAASFNISPNIKSVPVLHGWIQEDVTISANNAKLTDLAALLTKLHSETFPWIMNECRIVAVPGSPGQANITVVLRTIRAND